jgi:uncharacterized membrane protein
MDFAPYQDTAPEHERALSPPPRRSSSRSPIPKSPPPNRATNDPFATSALPPPSHFGGETQGNNGFGGGDIEGGRMNINLFETSLPIRLDYEAMLAYLLLPPAGGVLLLVMEHKSDYVRYVEHLETRRRNGIELTRAIRFHAWQSSLLFTVLFIIHLVFSFSTVMSWLLFVINIFLIGFLAWRAYRDGESYFARKPDDKRLTKSSGYSRQIRSPLLWPLSKLLC